MPKLQCHYCQSLKGLIILRSGLSICPKCLYDLPLDNGPLPAVIRNQFFFSPVIDPRGSLDFIGAQLMSNFIHNGMSVSSVARQMGIARATVYARLRKYKLMNPPDDGNLKIHPTLNDFAQSGGYNQNKRY